MGRVRRVKKVGVIVVTFDDEGAIKEAEVELDAPRFPLIEEQTFRRACLEAFMKAGGVNLHQ